HLDAEAPVDLNFTVVINPGNTEHQNALGLRDALEDLGFAVFGMSLQHEAEGIQHLANCLVKFWLRWVLRFYQRHHLFDILSRSFYSWRRNCATGHRGRSC